MLASKLNHLGVARDCLQALRPAVPAFKVNGISAPWDLGGPQRVTSNGATPLSSVQGAGTPSSIHSFSSIHHGASPHASLNGMTPLSMMGSNIPTPMSMYFPQVGTALTPTLSAAGSAGHGTLTPSAAGLTALGASGMTFTPTQFLAAQAMGGAQVPSMFLLSGGGNAGGGQGFWCVTPHAQTPLGCAQGHAGDTMLLPPFGQANSFAAPQAGNGIHPAVSGGHALSASTPMAGFGAPSMCVMTPQGAGVLSPGWLGQGTPMVTAGGMGFLLGGHTPHASQAQPTKAASASAMSAPVHAAGNLQSVGCALAAAAAREGSGGGDLAERAKLSKAARQDDKEKLLSDSQDRKRSRPPSQPSSGSALQAGGILGPLLAGKLPILENATNAGSRGGPTLPGFSPSIFLSTLSPTLNSNSPTSGTPALPGVQLPAIARTSSPASSGDKSADVVHISSASLEGGEDGNEKGRDGEDSCAHRPAELCVDQEPAPLMKLVDAANVTSVEGGGLRARRAAKAFATSASAEDSEAGRGADGADGADSAVDGDGGERKRRRGTAALNSDGAHNGDERGVGGGAASNKKRPPPLALGLAGVPPTG